MFHVSSHTYTLLCFMPIIALHENQLVPENEMYLAIC